MTAAAPRTAPVPAAGIAAGAGPWAQGRRVRLGRCVSLTVRGRPCWRPVPERGQRCAHCWGQLVVSPATSQRVELAAEPDLPEWVAALLVDDLEPMVRIVVAGRAGVAPDLLRRLAADPDPGVRATLAANGSLPADVDALLAGDPDGDVVIRVAARPGVAPALLSGLCRHPDPRVRGAVAGNTGADESLDRAVACTEADPAILAALAAKATTPDLVLSWLAQHPVPLVAEPAVRELRRRPSSTPRE